MSTANKEMSKSSESESNKERDIAIKAQNEYENNNFEESLKLLETLGDNKSVAFNRMITKFGISNDIQTLLSELNSCEDLEFDQQILLDYCRSLLMVKYENKYDEAIALLEKRMSLLTEPFGLVDEKIIFKLCHLLAIIYIERRKDPVKALSLLQFISDKCISFAPPSRYKILLF